MLHRMDPSPDGVFFKVVHSVPRNTDGCRVSLRTRPCPRSMSTGGRCPRCSGEAGGEGGRGGQRKGSSSPFPDGGVQLRSDPTGVAWGWAGPRLEPSGPGPKPFFSYDHSVLALGLHCRLSPQSPAHRCCVVLGSGVLAGHSIFCRTSSRF